MECSMWARRTISPVTNSRGSALFISVLIVAGVSAIIAMSIFSRSQDMAKVGSVYRAQSTKNQVEHELALIFADPTLCKNLIKINGTNFQINGGFQTTAGGNAVLSSDTHFAIKAMRLENITSLGAGVNRADFVVLTQNIADTKNANIHRSFFNAAYQADGAGNLTDCHIVVTLQQGCQELGMVYSGGRCQLCEKLGGSWNGSACSLPE